MKNTINISVVIPTLDEETNIQNCLQSLQTQTRRADEILVVDNGSEDKTVEIARSFGAKILSYPRPDLRFGNIGLVRQAGVEAAHGDIIVSTDADYTHPKDYLEKVDLYFTSNSKLVLLGGPIYNKDSDPWLDFINGIGNFHRSYWAGLGFPIFWGGNTSFRKDAFMLTDGYKGAAGHGPVEEWILSFRLSRVGEWLWSDDVYSYTKVPDHWRNYAYASLIPLSLTPLNAWVGLTTLTAL